MTCLHKSLLLTITINGQVFEFNGETNLATALVCYQLDSTFACAVNGVFIGKDQYQQTLLTSGDSIDVLVPIVGG
ncbi:MAG: sulfur carrier protein ThiS [Alteromonadaceae bacterium]|nr:sulfur carrier protein ThiS [Alteromonadaceae bacterium]